MREREAQDDIARTRIAPALAPGLVIAFLVPLLIVGAAQIWLGEAGAAARAIPSPAALGAATRAHGAIAANRLFTEGLHRFEASLEETSPVRTATLPSAQWVTTALLATGNTQTLVGRDRWLYFLPDIEHLTAPPFLETHDAAWAEMQAFAELRAPGRELFVLLVPPKPAIHPERLAPGLAGRTPLANPSTPDLLRMLARAGITVIDPSQLLVRAAAETGRAQYLATDTHWTPEGMDRAARAVAEAVTPHLPSLPPAGYSRRAGSVSNQGDLARLLRLPDTGELFAPETVALERVARAGEAAWRPDRDAQVLLLGDSFSLIYSDASMGWGESAGLAEQIAFHLQQPVDRLAIHAGGARRALARELETGSERMAGKRVVVYQLSARHLSAGFD